MDSPRLKLVDHTVQIRCKIWVHEPNPDDRVATMWEDVVEEFEQIHLMDKENELIELLAIEYKND